MVRSGKFLNASRNRCGSDLDGTSALIGYKLGNKKYCDLSHLFLSNIFLAFAMSFHWEQDIRRECILQIL